MAILGFRKIQIQGTDVTLRVFQSNGLIIVKIFNQTVDKTLVNDHSVGGPTGHSDFQAVFVYTPFDCTSQTQLLDPQRPLIHDSGLASLNSRPSLATASLPVPLT